MKSRLKVEALESRECPAAGSTLVPIATGPDFTLSVNTYGRFAVMEMSQPDWVDWQNGQVTAAQAQAMSQRLLSYFGDTYDQIWFINNTPEVNPNSPYFGVNFGFNNEVAGIGRPIQDNSAAWGSSGALNNFIHIASIKDFRQRTGLHEFIHLSGNFLPQLQSGAGGHWGFSSVGGQLGGWAPGTLQELVPAHLTQDGRGIYEADGPLGRDYFFTAFADIEDGDIPFSPLELYLLGLIGPGEVDPIQYAVEGDWEPSGQVSPFGIFTADAILTLTIQNIIAQEGLRTPTVENSQKNFRGLVVYATPNKLTQAEIDRFDTDVELFSRAGSDGDPNLLNFWEATGGRATFTMGGLDRFIPYRSPALSVGASNGQVFSYTTDATGGYGLSQALSTGLLAGVVGFGGSVRTATADVDGDSVPDIVVASGPGEPTRFAVLSGDLTRFIIPPTAPFRGSDTFTGGAFVSVGDINGDGRADVLVTPDEGGGPRVTIFAINAVNGVTVIADFLGINDPNFRGGARTSVGDIDRDGFPDIAVSAGFGGGPRVALYDGATFFTSRGRLAADFFAFAGADATRLRNGVFLAVGDINGDGFADLVFGGGPGGAPRVTVLSGATVVNGGVLAAQGSPLANFFVAGNSQDRGGIRVAVKNVDGDANMEIVTGSGEGSVSRVRVYRGATITPSGEPKVLQDLDPLSGGFLEDGLFVG